MEMIIYLSLVG